MMVYDRGSSLFWLALSISVFIESLRLGIGTPGHPGIGFMAFGASGLLGIFSLMLFLKTFLKKGEEKTEPLFAGTLWGRVIIILIALLIYAKIMPLAGYLVSTFLLMTFLYWLARGQRWWWVLVSSLLTTTLSYFVFSKCLNLQFPTGFLSF